MPSKAKKKAAKRAATRKQSLQVAKPRKTKRSAISGRYGGEKEAEALARRIARICYASPLLAEPDRKPLTERIKAELLAATVVEETTAEVLWEGWACVYEDAEQDPFGPWCCHSTQKQAKQYAHEGDVVEAVALVRRKAGRARRKGEK